MALSICVFVQLFFVCLRYETAATTYRKNKLQVNLRKSVCHGLKFTCLQGGSFGAFFQVTLAYKQVAPPGLISPTLFHLEFTMNEQKNRGHEINFDCNH